MPGPALSERDLEVLRSFARRIDPSDAGAHNNLGVLYYNKGLVDEASPPSRARSSSTRRCRSRSATSRSPTSTPATTTAASPSCRSGCAARPTTATRAGSWAAPTRLSRHDRRPQGSRSCSPHARRRPRSCSSASPRRRAAASRPRAAASRALPLDPDSSVARFYLGEVLYNRGLNEAALAALEAAIELNPDNPDAHYLLGFVLGDMGRHERAREATKRAIHSTRRCRARRRTSRSSA